MAKETILITQGKHDNFYFNGKAIKSSVKAKKVAETLKGGTLSKGDYIGEETENGITYVTGIQYDVNLVTSWYYVTTVGQITVDVPSTITIEFSWEPYIAPPSPPTTPSPISAPSPSPVPEVIEIEPATETEWESYVTSWGGFNVPFVDEYHQSFFFEQIHETFESPHLKNVAQATEVAKKIIFDSQLDLEVNFPASPFFAAELGDCVNISIPLENIDSVSRLRDIAIIPEDQTVIFTMNTTEVI